MLFKMEYFKFVVLICCVSFVFAEESEFVKPCKRTDIQCIQKTTQNFLERTAKGIPAHNIKPIDPMIVDSLEFDLGFDSGIVHHITNLNVTGFKNTIIDNFKMDTETHKVQFTMNMDLHLDGLLTVQFTKQNKQFSGSYTGKGKASATTYYPFTLKKGEDGVEHYEVGDETYTYDVQEAPDVHPDPVLLKELRNDIDITDARKIFLDNREEILKNCMVKLLEVTVPTLMHNLKQAAKMLPKEAFFSD